MIKKIDFKKNEIYYKIYELLSILIINNQINPTILKGTLEEFYSKLYEKSSEIMNDSVEITHESKLIISSFYELYYKFFNLKSNNISDFEENFNLDTISIKSGYYNFYKDGNPTEIKLLFLQMQKILSKISVFKI